MHTILGAGGAIGRELVGLLSGRGLATRVVSRTLKDVPTLVQGVPADLLDRRQTMDAVSGSDVVYLLAGLRYDVTVWSEEWPRIMRNTIDACQAANARLIFFDNVYMYGKVSGPMTEETSFHPCSRKGDIRARIAQSLLNEIRAGHLTAMIARSADFYGPRVRNGIPNILVFDAFSKGRTASWLINDSVPHSFTYVPDAARALTVLSEAHHAWNQTWHLPTAPSPPTGKAFVRMAAEAFGAKPKCRVLGRTSLSLAGWFSRDIRELNEMLYQYDSEYLFDSGKFSRAFGFEPTSYTEGIRKTAEAYRG